MNLSYFSKKFDEHFSLLNERELGISAGFIQRTPRKISPFVLLKALCLSFTQLYKSYNQIAITISIIKGLTVSKQAVAKRIGLPVVNLCKSTLAALLSKQVIYSEECYTIFSKFKRVLVQDSTSIHLPLNMAEKFPGSRNRFNIQYAVAKIQSIIDLKKNSFIDLIITPFTKNDQAVSGDIIKILNPGDLVIRDLGYFVLPVFKKIADRNAFFISRLRNDITLLDKKMNRLKLIKELKRFNKFDQWVYTGVKEKLFIRVVAIPLPKQIADERRRKLRSNRDLRLNPSKERFELCSWAIFITNVSKDIWSAEQIKEIYKLRWRIEIIFKAWKSHFKLTQFESTSNQYIIETMIYARLIYILIFNTVLFVPFFYKSRDKNKKGISLLKLSKYFSHDIISYLECENTSFSSSLISYFCSYEKRKKRKNYLQLLQLS